MLAGADEDEDGEDPAEETEEVEKDTADETGSLLRNLHEVTMIRKPCSVPITITSFKFLNSNPGKEG